MRSSHNRTLVGALGAGAVLLLAPAAAALTLVPGTILGEDSVGPGGTTATLVQYSPTGVILDTLALSNLGNFGTVDGVAIVGGDVFVTGTSGVVGQVDLTTGVLFNAFNVGGTPEALGDLNGNLLVGQFGADRVDVFSTSGALLNSINLSAPAAVTGLDSDGSVLYVASYNDGAIYSFDLSGGLLGSFSTGLGPSSLSGLGYDGGTNTLWVSSGFNQDRIHQFSVTGTPLASFDAGRPFIDGLDVVPTIPEPATAALSAAGLAALAGRGRRS